MRTRPHPHRPGAGRFETKQQVAPRGRPRRTPSPPVPLSTTAHPAAAHPPAPRPRPGRTPATPPDEWGSRHDQTQRPGHLRPECRPRTRPARRWVPTTDGLDARRIGRSTTTDPTSPGLGMPTLTDSELVVWPRPPLLGLEHRWVRFVRCRSRHLFRYLLNPLSYRGRLISAARRPGSVASRRDYSPDQDLSFVLRLGAPQRRSLGCSTLTVRRRCAPPP